MRLVITPTVLGAGRRLFAADAPPVGMRAVEASITSGGLTVLVFETTGPAAFATYEGAAAVGT